MAGAAQLWLQQTGEPRTHYLKSPAHGDRAALGIFLRSFSPRLVVDAQADTGLLDGELINLPAYLFRVWSRPASASGVSSWLPREMP